MEALKNFAQDVQHELDSFPPTRFLSIKAAANCTNVVLSGKCSTWYQKQLAQEAAKRILQNRAGLVNEIEVLDKK